METGKKLGFFLRSASLQFWLLSSEMAVGEDWDQTGSSLESEGGGMKRVGCFQISSLFCRSGVSS